MKTVFITGSSSGIGRETARLFADKGWNVIATMRKPELETEFRQRDTVRVIQCDVTEPDSIRAAVEEGLTAFGKIDVLVNNAGFYTIGVLEAATEEQIIRQVETNLLGVIRVTKAVLPHLREQRSGTIVNISSIAGRMAVPLQTLYHAAKWGVEGFSESLQYELLPFNIKVKIIEPGVINTDFYGRSMSVMEDINLSEYQEYSQKVAGNLVKNGRNGSAPAEVAEMVYRAVNAHGGKMRYTVGKSKGVIALNSILPDGMFHRMMSAAMLK